MNLRVSYVVTFFLIANNESNLVLIMSNPNIVWFTQVCHNMSNKFFKGFWGFATF